MIKLDTNDIDFLSMVVKKGNSQQSAAAAERLEDLMRLDAMAGGEGHVYLDSKDDGGDPVERARLDMIDRHQNAWRAGTRLDATYVQASAAEEPRSGRMMAGDAEDKKRLELEEDAADKARAAMVERHRNAWRKPVWQPGQD